MGVNNTLQLPTSTKKSAFSLLECLVTLLVTAMILFSLSSILHLYQHWYYKYSEDYTDQWHHLSLLLEQELQHFKFVNLQPNSLLVTSGTQNYRLVLRRGTLYKTPGYHPYAFHVREWKLTYQAPLLILTLTYTNDQSFTGYFYLEES